MKWATAALALFISGQLSAQSWSINGNASIAAGTNYLGTSDPNDLVFRTNAIERGRVFGAGGAWRFGTATNYATIDSIGRLSFTGKGVYQVGGNKYAFQFSGNPNLGLYFNSSLTQFEFRDAAGLPAFTLVPATGAGTYKGSLTVGAYTLPATDGSANQVLKTNGAGVLAWSADNNTTYTAGTGLNLVGTTFNNTAPDQTVTLAGSNGISTSGAYPNFTVNGAGLWRTTGNTGLSAGTNFIGTTDAVDVVFRAANTEGMRLTNANRRLGLGSTTPSAKLHINSAASEDALRVQTNGNTRLYIDDLGGVSIGSTIAGPADGLYVSGNLGIGVSAPTSKLQVAGDLNFDGDNSGIIFNTGEYIRDAVGAVTTLEVHADFVPDNTASHSLGSSTNEWIDVWAVDGSINLVSAKTTKNVKNLPYGINEVMKLRPVMYNRINNPEGGDGTRRLGLLAEELKIVVPEVVKDWTYAEDEVTKKVTKVASTQLGVSLENMIPVLIKAIQEQQAQIEELKKMNGISSSGQAPPSVSEENAINVRLSNEMLDQNIPNPLANNTSIRYNIPANAGNASLVIRDMNGKAIRQITLKPGAGTVNIDAAALNAGTYSYTLIVDGKQADSKKMVVAR